MTNGEAVRLLSLHLMQCGALMPISWLETHGEGSEFMEAFRMAFDALKGKVEPVIVAEWICAYEKDDWWEHRSSTPYKCSNCGRRAGRNQLKVYKRCPECGAHMREGKD